MLATKNLCGKTRPATDPYEVWKSFDGSWTWSVRKKYQAPGKEASNPYARWYCTVVNPMTGSDGETGDVYVRDIVSQAVRVK